MLGHILGFLKGVGHGAVLRTRRGWLGGGWTARVEAQVRRRAPKWRALVVVTTSIGHASGLPGQQLCLGCEGGSGGVGVCLVLSLGETWLENFILSVWIATALCCALDYPLGVKQ